MEDLQPNAPVAPAIIDLGDYVGEDEGSILTQPVMRLGKRSRNQKKRDKKIQKKQRDREAARAFVEETQGTIAAALDSRLLAVCRIGSL